MEHLKTEDVNKTLIIKSFLENLLQLAVLFKKMATKKQYKSYKNNPEEPRGP